MKQQRKNIMPRGRPPKPVTKKEVQLIVKREIENALSQLDVKTVLVGTKKKGRPLGSKIKGKKGRKTA
jgi:hypothetical protein